MKIDTSIDFTLDTPHYWEKFWDVREGLGVGGGDPDAQSKTLQLYHKVLWSRKLPCGEKMELQFGTGANYLQWNDFRFGSDSIIASFRYNKYRYMLDEVQKAISDYRSFVENYIHKSYTIGGMMIFPKHSGSINQIRGTNHKLCDRWDLTLECIRRYYNNEDSPLHTTLVKDKYFFDLFVDFKGYVDFFFLQDCVSEDYRKVNLWLGNDFFEKNPVPQNADEYLTFIGKEYDFLKKRNRRILNFKINM